MEEASLELGKAATCFSNVSESKFAKVLLSNPRMFNAIENNGAAWQMPVERDAWRHEA